jgi:hypothetical protein
MFGANLNDFALTKELIQDQISAEAILHHFLGLKPQASFCSPFRNDTKPSASVFYNAEYEPMYYDFGTGFYGDWVEVGKLYYQCDYRSTVLERIWAELVAETITETNEVYDIKVSSGFTDIQVKTRRWESYDAEIWKPLTLKQLEYYDVFPLEYVWINGIVSQNLNNSRLNPTYGYVIKNPEEEHNRWKIYKPKDEGMNKWRTNIEKNCLMGRDIKETSVLCTSLKDAMAFRSITKIPACCYQSESYIPQRLPSHIKCLVRDNDRQGLKYAQKLHERFKLPFISFEGGKDVFKALQECGVESLKSQWDNLNRTLKLINN